MLGFEVNVFSCTHGRSLAGEGLLVVGLLNDSDIGLKV